MKIILQREKENNVQTTGKLIVGDYKCYTLELAWRDNEFQISRIPAGVYNVQKRYSKKYKNHFHIKNVPDRDMILIHAGNFYYDTLGCILVGDNLKDINIDGNVDVVNSIATMNKLNELLPDEFEIEIKNIDYIGDLDPKTEKRI